MATEEPSPSRSRGFGGEPARLDEAAIDFLHGREEPDGVIHAHPLPPGSSVHILLDIPQRQTRVQMPETWVREVALASTAPP